MWKRYFSIFTWDFYVLRLVYILIIKLIFILKYLEYEKIKITVFIHVIFLIKINKLDYLELKKINLYHLK